MKKNTNNWFDFLAKNSTKQVGDKIRFGVILISKSGQSDGFIILETSFDHNFVIIYLFIIKLLPSDSSQ